MWKYDQLSDVQRGLLEKNTVDLQGEVDEQMVRYVREALLRLTVKGSPPITVFITSGGGSAGIGLDIYDDLMMYSGKKVGLVGGFARSMAAVILQACDLRLAMRNARLLIHHVSRREVSLDVLRNAKKVEKLRQDVERRQSSIDRILAQRTGKTVLAIRKQCEKDEDMRSEEALRFHLIDKIVDSHKDLSVFLEQK